MKRLIIAAMLIATPALAADPAPPVAPAAAPTPVPVTLSVDKLNQLNAFLQAQPYSVAAPIIQWFAGLEQQAQADAAKAKK